MTNAETSSDRRAARFVIDGDVVLLRPSFLASRWLSLRRRPTPSPVTAISAAIIAAAAALSRAYFFVVATRVRARGDQRVERLGCECSVVPSPSPIPLPSPSAEEGRQAARCIETMYGDWLNAIPIVHDDGVRGGGGEDGRWERTKREKKKKTLTRP